MDPTLVEAFLGSEKSRVFRTLLELFPGASERCSDMPFSEATALRPYELAQRRAIRGTNLVTLLSVVLSPGR